ncbi:MFS transporter [Microvirga sp. W0021]|uniref:MFS transporter n=1 Tax=Hohaiivirga grylli TaxID=3133970 RepID=A0ABV0BHI1_9HYPH
MFISKRWLNLAIVSSALFLIVVDITVLYTALPRITHDLSATASEKLWIVNAYGLVVAGLLPGTGSLSDRVGHRRMFLIGLVIFGFASIMAAYAFNPEILIIARVVLAIGAAVMMPATLSIIRLTFKSEQEQSVAFGIWSSVASGGAAIGPVFGGFLLSYFWWGSVFLVNVPVVIIAFVMTLWIVPEHQGNKQRKWDMVSSFQIMITLVALVYLIKAIGMGNASSLTIIASAGIFLFAGSLFLMRQRKSEERLIDASLFCDVRFTAGVGAALMASLAMSGVELVFTQRLQLVLELTPLQAGFVILPLPIAAFVAGPLSGYLMTRLGGLFIMWSGLLVTALGLLILWMTYDGYMVGQALAMLILGFGIGAAMTAASGSIMMYAPKDKAGMAASVQEVSFEFGGALGIAILGSLMTAFYSASLTLSNAGAISAKVFDSLDQALMISETLDTDMAETLLREARGAFDASFSLVIIVALGLTVITACAVMWAARRQ